MVLRGVWGRDRGPAWASFGEIERREGSEGLVGRGERSVEEMKSRPPGTFPAAKGGRATLGTCFRAWAAMRDSLPDEGVVEGQKEREAALELFCGWRKYSYGGLLRNA